MGKPLSPKAVKIDWLKDHPRQREFFADTSDSELQELAADLERRGQQEPIHCCADGTLIRGHRRVQAAKHLGWQTIQAVIRHDLGEPDDPRVIDELIADNLIRRQLDELSLARCYRELKRAAQSAPDSGVGGDLRDQLAARLNCGKSGRSLDRLERLLDLPRVLQDCISRGELTKSHGEKILRLPPDRQQAIAQAVQDGGPGKQILRDHGVISPPRPDTPADLGKDLLSFLDVYLPQLKQNLKALDRLQVRGGRTDTVLEDAASFFAAWRDRKARLRQQSINAMREKCD